MTLARPPVAIYSIQSVLCITCLEYEATHGHGEPRPCEVLDPGSEGQWIFIPMTIMCLIRHNVVIAVDAMLAGHCIQGVVDAACTQRLCSTRIFVLDPRCNTLGTVSLAGQYEQ